MAIDTSSEAQTAQFSPEIQAVLGNPDALQTLFAVFTQQRKNEADAAREAREAAKREHATFSADMREMGLDFLVENMLVRKPVSASSKEDSAWVGSASGAITVTLEDGREYSVSISVKDVAASAARKAALGK